MNEINLIKATELLPDTSYVGWSLGSGMVSGLIARSQQNTVDRLQVSKKWEWTDQIKSLATHGYPSHAFMIIPDAHVGHMVYESHFETGVHCIPWKTWSDQVGMKRHEVWVAPAEIKIPLAKQLLGEPYSTRNIFRLEISHIKSKLGVQPRQKPDADGYICSEYVSTCLVGSPVNAAFGLEHDQIEPAHIALWFIDSVSGVVL